jgi:tetratricopeptide (TPR) repeat protein
MVQMLFFLRFRAQLRRTRPELIARLETEAAGIMEDAGGKTKMERRLLSGLFDENSLGFWLDMLIALETIQGMLEGAAAELYGYSLILGRDIPEQGTELLCRNLAPDAGSGGLWFDGAAKKALSPYMYFEKPPRDEKRRPGETEGFVRLKGIKTFSRNSPSHYPFRETILRALRQGSVKNAVLLGSEFIGKRDGVYRFCGEQTKPGPPPLVIRFGALRGLASLADAWTGPLRSFLGGRDKTALAELDQLGESLFRDRLRDEVSGYMLRQGRRFFSLLLESYAAETRNRRAVPVLILENIHRAGETAAGIIIDAFNAFAGAPSFMVLGTCAERDGEAGADMKSWEPIFTRVIRISAEGYRPPEAPEMSGDLWEIAYALELLGRYFPGAMMIELFEAEGKNPAMISRAMEQLAFLGLIDSPEDPRPRLRQFAEKAERALGNGGDKVRALVRNRFLDWVKRNRLNPCFRLLEALAAVGGAGTGRGGTNDASGDELILKSICADLVNGTTGAMEDAMVRGSFEKITGTARAPTIRYIVSTLGALLHGDEEAVRRAFQETPPEFYPPYKARALANLGSYYLGMGDVSAAMEKVKEAIRLSQDRHWAGLAPSYRLFSLVNLSKQQMGETIEYITFAVENGERGGDYQELGIAAYYAAAAQFLYGNLSRARRFALQAETQASLSGCPEWADKSRFLRGKLAFEIGHYREALEIFEALRESPFSPPSPEKERLLGAWIYRARVYAGGAPAVKPEDGGIDADLFEVEAAWLSGRYDATLELSAALFRDLPRDTFLFTEQPDWRSGFAQCELLLLPRTQLWNRMITVYHSLALCRLAADIHTPSAGIHTSAAGIHTSSAAPSAGTPAGGDEAIRSMQHIIRDERLADVDPCNVFYFYAWYRVLQETGAAQVDLNTAVSMAFKRLQRRASRIDDIETRRDFLTLPRWNAALSLAAKEYKLI